MAYKFPGVYPTIQDASGILVNNNVTSCGYVGLAEYGPVFVPTRISTLQEFTNVFGTLNSKYGYAGYSLAVAAETINGLDVPSNSIAIIPRRKNITV